MISLLAAGVILCGQGNTESIARAFVFGGGKEPLPDRTKISDLVLKAGKAPGWKDLPDGKIVYVSPKQMAYIFLPSLREVQNWKTAMFFRKKIESGGFWTVFEFDELPEFLKTVVESSSPEMNFTSKSSLQVEINIVTNISSSGRKIAIPFKLMRPIAPGKRDPEKSKQLIDSANLPPVEPKRDYKRSEAEEPWRPFYQVWNLNVFFDKDRTSMVDEALRLINTEMDKRTAVETQALFKLLQDNEQVRAYQELVGRPVDMSPQNFENRISQSVGQTLGVFRNAVGLNEDSDWSNFTQHATVDTLSLSFSISFVKLYKGNRQMVGVGF